MGVRPPRADEDGLDFRFRGEVVGEGGLHTFTGEVREGEMVGGGGREDEGVNLGEGVRGDDVDRFDSGREIWVSGEGGQVEDEEDKAVFATIVGEGEGVNSGERIAVSMAARKTNIGIDRSRCAFGGFLPLTYIS